MSQFLEIIEWFDETGYDVDIAKNAKESGIAPTKFDTWAAAQKWSAPVPAA